MAEDLTKKVERLWQAFLTGGIGEVADLVDEDVVWEPVSAGGRALHGRDALLAFDAENRRAGRRIDAQLYALEQRDDAVIVAAYVRVAEPAGSTAWTAHWVYRFAGGRLRRAESYATREQALAALGS